MLKFCLSLIIIILLVQGIALADFYKWEDENGNIHITDYPPPTKSVKNVQVHKNEYNSTDASTPTKRNSQETSKKRSSDESNIKPSENHEVVLYTTSWCPYCKMARDFFISRNISFTDYDIEKDKDAAQRKKQLDNKSGVPFAIINGQAIHGYSQSAYENALQKNQ